MHLVTNNSSSANSTYGYYFRPDGLEMSHHMAMQQNNNNSGQVGGGSNPMDVILNNLDTVPNMIYGLLMVVLITFSGQIGSTVSGYADSALGRVLGIGLVIGITHTLGWSYGLLTALAFLLIVHNSPRLAATGIDSFEDLKRHQAKGTMWFVERVLGERPEGITTDNAITEAVQDDSEIGMMNSKSK